MYSKDLGNARRVETCALEILYGHWIEMFAPVLARDVMTWHNERCKRSVWTGTNDRVPFLNQQFSTFRKYLKHEKSDIFQVTVLKTTIEPPIRFY